MQISPEILFSIAGFPVTNTVIATVITDIVIIVLVFMVSKTVALKPGGTQNAIEAVIDYFRETKRERETDRGREREREINRLQDNECRQS